MFSNNLFLLFILQPPPGRYAANPEFVPGPPLFMLPVYFTGTAPAFEMMSLASEEVAKSKNF